MHFSSFLNLLTYTTIIGGTSLSGFSIYTIVSNNIAQEEIKSTSLTKLNEDKEKLNHFFIGWSDKKAKYEKEINDKTHIIETQKDLLEKASDKNKVFLSNIKKLNNTVYQTFLDFVNSLINKEKKELDEINEIESSISQAIDYKQTIDDTVIEFVAQAASTKNELEAKEATAKVNEQNYNTEVEKKSALDQKLQDLLSNPPTGFSSLEDSKQAVEDAKNDYASKQLQVVEAQSKVDDQNQLIAESTEDVTALNVTLEEYKGVLDKALSDEKLAKEKLESANQSLSNLEKTLKPFDEEMTPLTHSIAVIALKIAGLKTTWDLSLQEVSELKALLKEIEKDIAINKALAIKLTKVYGELPSKKAELKVVKDLLIDKLKALNEHQVTEIYKSLKELLDGETALTPNVSLDVDGIKNLLTTFGFNQEQQGKIINIFERIFKDYQIWAALEAKIKDKEELIKALEAYISFEKPKLLEAVDKLEKINLEKEKIQEHINKLNES